MGSRKIITYYNVELILIYNWSNWKQNFFDYMKVILIESITIGKNKNQEKQS